MKFLKLSFIGLLMTAAFSSCDKEKEITPPVPAEKPSPAPATEKSIQGVWAGKSVMINKSIPVYFSFTIQAGGKLDLLNATQQVIGSGTWTLNGNSFKAIYTFTASGDVCSAAADLYNGTPDKFSGTWGYNTTDSGGGFWNMEKIN